MFVLIIISIPNTDKTKNRKNPKKGRKREKETAERKKQKDICIKIFLYLHVLLFTSPFLLVEN